jgi:Family of unknown function (DUF6600)
MRSRKRFGSAVLCAASAALAASATFAQAPAGAIPDAETAVSARLSLVEGAVSYQRGDDDDWMPAAVNAPFVWGDRVYADRGSRAELQISGGSMIRIADGTELTALDLAENVKQLKVGIGTVSVRLRVLDPEEVYEFDTPNAAVTLQTPGLYRIEVDEEGNTRAAVRQGEISISSAGGEVPVGEGEEIVLRGIDQPVYDIVPFGGPDVFDRWCDRRDRLYLEARSYGYVSPAIAGAAVLDQYGDWRMENSFGWVWFPRVAAGGWSPYRLGHWVWIDPWGWTWASAEPWGWAPYHYGRWALIRSRWAWIPVASSVVRVEWAPALVGFMGAGPGWGLGGFGGEAYVGWFPLGPGDPLVAYWRPRWALGASAARARFVNRAYAIVVPQSAFVEARPVNSVYVRDAAVVRRIAGAPIARGPVPVVPTAASLRMAEPSRARVPVPSARVLSRPVVVRGAPPPSPPPFELKRSVIAENHGAPVQIGEAEALAARSGARARAPVRAAAVGAPALRPARGTVPEPGAVTPFRGRSLARPEAAVLPRAAAPPAPKAVPERPSPRPPQRDAVPSQGGSAAPPRQAPPPSEAPKRREPSFRERTAPPSPSPAQREPRQTTPRTTAPVPPPERPAARERRGAPEGAPAPAPPRSQPPSPPEHRPEARGRAPESRPAQEKKSETKKPEKKEDKKKPDDRPHEG